MLNKNLDIDMYVKNDLNRGKICETNKPNKTEIQIRVFGQMLAYVDRGLRTQAKSHVRKI